MSFAPGTCRDRRRQAARRNRSPHRRDRTGSRIRAAARTPRAPCRNRDRARCAVGLDGKLTISAVGLGTEWRTARSSARSISSSGRRRHAAHRGAGDDEAELVDRIGRVRHQDRVAGAGDGGSEVGEPLLRAERRDDLGFRVERDVETPLVIARQRPAQAGNALAGGVAMRARILHRLDQLGDDVRRRRAVRIAHAEVDDVLRPRRARAPWPCSPRRRRRAAGGGCGGTLRSWRSIGSGHGEVKEGGERRLQQAGPAVNRCRRARPRRAGSSRLGACHAYLGHAPYPGANKWRSTDGARLSRQRAGPGRHDVVSPSAGRTVPDARPRRAEGVALSALSMGTCNAAQPARPPAARLGPSGSAAAGRRATAVASPSPSTAMRPCCPALGERPSGFRSARVERASPGANGTVSAAQCHGDAGAQRRRREAPAGPGTLSNVGGGGGGIGASRRRHSSELPALGAAA